MTMILPADESAICEPPGDESGLVLSGLLVLADPMRPDAAEMVKALAGLGVVFKMVTGDGAHQLTLNELAVMGRYKTKPIIYKWRAWPLGDRTQRYATDTGRLLLGGEGTISGKWDYRLDLSHSFSRTTTDLTDGYANTVLHTLRLKWKPHSTRRR